MGESFYHNSKRGFLKIKVIFFFKVEITFSPNFLKLNNQVQHNQYNRHIVNVQF